MLFWRTRQGAGILLIVVATISFAVLDTVTKLGVKLAPVMMLLWGR